MISKNIIFFNFKIKKNTKKKILLKKYLKNLLTDKSEFIKSLGSGYIKNYNINIFKKKLDLKIIGVGGSILGAKAINQFLSNKIKKKVQFIDNISNNNVKNNKKNLNIVISKSGNTLETIFNANVIIKKKDQNIFIIENRNNELIYLAKKLKSEIIEHNNFIGGRYSVLSETGMVPAELMGLNPDKFRQLNNIVKNKIFLDTLVNNVNSILAISKKRTNAILLNYNPELESMLEWYKQLISESLGKQKKGFLPVISNMPKDNHSIMQLYLDGAQNNFFTFFSLKNQKGIKTNNYRFSKNFNFLKDLSSNQILKIQEEATKNVFIKKNIPFRSFEILKKSEETLGELFIFFMFEVILLARALKINPYDQPSVELIKKETKRILY